MGARYAQRSNAVQACLIRSQESCCAAVGGHPPQRVFPAFYALDLLGEVCRSLRPRAHSAPCAEKTLIVPEAWPEVACAHSCSFGS